MFLICKISNKTKMKSKQRSFEDFIGTSFVLIDANLLLIWMNNFQLCFCFHLASCAVLPAMLIISREECMLSKIMIMFQINIYMYKIQMFRQGDHHASRGLFDGPCC